MPIRVLFLDMNSFFASVEQQLCPRLRNCPMAVAPMLTDHTCCIAASYEARPYGIRTGTNVGEARRRCPHLRLVEARHELASRVPLGHVCALTFSAAGLVYCAFGESDRVKALAEREMAQSRAVGRASVPTSWAELEQLAAVTRTQGFATIAVEGDGGLAAVSSPVFNASGTRLQFALTVFGRPGRLNVTPDGPVAALMAEAARSLGAELHGHPTAGSRR